MTDILITRDIESLVTVKRLSAASSAVAAGAGDATTVTGVTIDRAGFSPSLPLSVAAAVLYEATLASGKTLGIGYAWQDSADASTWADYQTATTAVVATGPSGGGAVAGEFKIPANLTSARRYVRLNFFPHLSATGTDTSVHRAVGAFAGFSRNPAPNA